MIRNRKGTGETRTSSTRSLWTAGLALIVVVLVILHLNGGLEPSAYSKVAIGVAVVFLVGRQVSRRSKGKRLRAAEPDPQSQLHLD